ncbi:MAG: (2Fe-2S)-binding protein [Acholeplasmatales bacterium]|nr:MAG: (2Fe-2S)-binding protein [Acholeplasmatales bacterium]
MKIKFMLNDRSQTWHTEPGESLLDLLRRHHVVSVKKGCDGSTCGVCTVLMNQKPVLACTVLAVRCAGEHIHTVEGLADEVEKISEAFGIEGADQCGFCNPGIALALYALKAEHPEADAAEIKQYLEGHLCRCSGYQSQVKAALRYLGEAS